MIRYSVNAGDTLSRIAKSHNVSLAQILQVNPRLQRNPDALRVGEVISIPQPDQSGTETDETAFGDSRGARDAVLRETLSTDELTVPKGQLTFDAEGLDVPGAFFSRVPHVPTGSSGVTLGRGYDMKEREPDKIERDLVKGGVEDTEATRFRGASTLAGTAARRFIQVAGLAAFEISHQVQKALFGIAYEAIEKDVIRICSKADVERIYGETDWPNLSPYVRDVIVDLRYRGDYTPATRREIQEFIASNDAIKIADLMKNEVY